MSSPLISVVIPTRNRAHLLELALRSALEQQGFSDYEVIVSDNSPKATAKVVADQWSGHDKLRYVNTGEDLDVYGSWNFALEQASGRYTFLLADDDCLMPRGLATLARSLRRHKYPDFVGVASCWYSHPSRQAPPVNALRFDHNWTEEGQRDPKELLQAFFSFRRPTFSPTYVMVSEGVRQELTRRDIKAYIPLYPDYGLQAMALALADSAAVLREPTVVHGYAAESMGEQAFGQRKQIAWDSVIGQDNLFQCSPLGGYYFINGWLETLLRVQALLPQETGELVIGWMAFFEQYIANVFREGLWRDVRPDFEALAAFLGTLDPQLKEAVMQRNKSALECLYRVVEVKAWEKLGPEQAQWIGGQEHGFEDIIGASAAAMKLYRAGRQREQMMAYLLGQDTQGKR